MYALWTPITIVKVHCFFAAFRPKTCHYTYKINYASVCRPWNLRITLAKPKCLNPKFRPKNYIILSSNIQARQQLNPIGNSTSHQLSKLRIFHSIHPRYKRPIADRLVVGALSEAYDWAVNHQGPLPTGLLLDGLGSLLIIYNRSTDLVFRNFNNEVIFEVLPTINSYFKIDDHHGFNALNYLLFGASGTLFCLAHYNLRIHCVIFQCGVLEKSTETLLLLTVLVKSSTM